MATVKNETVTVTVEDDDGNRTVLTIPAFNRRGEELLAIVKEHLGDYLLRSIESEAPLSLADFALWLLTKASKEPLTTVG